MEARLKHPKVLSALSCLILVLSLLSIWASPAHATSDAWNQISIQGSNGQPQSISVFGHYESINGGTDNLLVEDATSGDTSGDPTGRVFLNGVQIGTTTTQVPVTTTELDPTRTHTLYAAENFPSVLYKGSVPLEPYWAASTQLSVTCPYSTLQNEWQWVVYQYTNDNSWPVVADINVNLNGNGEPWTGYESFAANQTKYLKLDINSNMVGQSVANNLWTWADTHQNLDPAAPPIPPATESYITDPEADDNSGINWTADEWEGLTFSPVANGSYVPYYTSNCFWALQPGFVQEPTWVPNTGEDPHWGTIQYNTVPGYVWVRQAGFSAWPSGGLYVDASRMPGVPQVVPGGAGSTVSQKPASGPYETVYDYTQIAGTVTNSGSSTYTWTGNMNSDLASFNNWKSTTYPSYQDLNNGTLVQQQYSTYYEGCFYTDSSHANVIVWSVNSNYYSWTSYKVTTTSGETEANPPPSTPDGQYYVVSTGSNTVTITATNYGYKPISGSYDQVQSISTQAYQSRNGPQAGITGVTYVYHEQVYNPGPGTVTFSQTSARENGDSYFLYYFDCSAASPRQVSIPPGQLAWLTSTYTLPQASYQICLGGGRDSEVYAPYAFWAPNADGNGELICCDFGVGCARPAGRMDVWSASGILNDCVAYDWGDIVFQDSLYTVDSGNAPPGFYGSELEDVSAMTPAEITDMTGLQPATWSKIQAIENGGYASWTAQKHLFSVKQSGYNAYLSAS